MRSAQLFRNDNVIRLLRPFWDSSRSPKLGRNVINQKKDDAPNSDPYDGNYNFFECDQYTKVTVVGAAGRVGKTLSLLLKTCPLIDHLCLFDIDKAVKGVGVDISHVDTKCCISYVCGMRNIQQALDAPDVVIIAAGCPTSPSLNGKRLFEKNAPVVAGLSEACARFCPKACVILVTNPINSLLPVMGEVYQVITNRIPSRKLFGLTTLDVVRANTFVAEVVRKDPNSVIVPVVGGTSQETIVPVISQMKPCCKIKRGEMIALTECLKRAESNLEDCQNCGTRGSSTLSTAYAGFRFTSSLVMALKGAEDIIECAFVKSSIIPELEYLASPLKLGVRGIEYNFGYPPLSDYELAGLQQSAAVLMSDIKMGKAFVASIEETIQKGLVWKRLSEDTPKISKEPAANEKDSQKKEQKPQERKTELEKNKLMSRKKQPEEKKEDRENVSKEVHDPEPQSTPLIREVYSEGMRHWTAQTSFGRLFGGSEVQGSCSEVTTNSISADLDSDSCREDSSFHEKHLEELLPNEDTAQSSIAPTAQQTSSSRKKQLLLKTFPGIKQFSRRFHTMRKESPGYETKNVKNTVEKDKYRRYLMEDREKTLIPVQEIENPIDPVVRFKIKKIQSGLRRQQRNLKTQNNQYKSLNAAAKQKFRSYNMQKKFTPSASVLLLLDKRKKERAGKNIEIVMHTDKDRPSPTEVSEKIEENKALEEKEEAEGAVAKGTKDEDKQLVVRGEKDELTKYKEFIFQQLRQLKKENEELKKRIAQLSQDKSLQTALQAQSDHLELERTKLKACWLIMSSTMDAFSNFCKKFTSKTEAQIMEAAKDFEKQPENMEEQESEEEDFDDAFEAQEEKKSPGRYDEKYFNFLEKLMEDQMESRLESELKRKIMKK